MSEPREKMKPYLSKRVSVRGTLAGFDTAWKTGHRYTGRACITSPEINDEVVCDHASVVDVPHWKEHRMHIGSQVTFDAVVQSYTDKNGRISYCFGNAGELTFLHQPPALAIPDLLKDEEPCEDYEDDSAPDEELEQPQIVAPSTSHANPMECIRQAKVFAKICGGFDKAEEIVSALPPMPTAELLEYIRALKE